MSKIFGTKVLFLILAASLALGACTKPPQNESVLPTLTPPPTEEQEFYSQENNHNPGSLFDPGRNDYLFSDNRARRVGDIVLVQIVENSKGSSKADTETGRDASHELGVSAAFNSPTFGLGPATGDVGANPMLGATSKSDFKGEGETSRENTMTATIGARVVSILPGGLMQVEGAREVRVNEEVQIVVVRGLVRPRDISPDNTILSSHMSDVRIDYFGKGVLADKQRPGWLSRILDYVWPF